MNKNDILKTVQKENSENSHSLDEREMQIMLKASRFAIITSFILCIILMLAKMEANQTYYDVYGISTTILACQNLYFGIKTHNRYNFWIGVCWSLFSIFIIVVYINDILG